MSKPRILLLPDVRGWAFHTTARAIAKYAGNAFDIDIAFIREQPDIDASGYDIIHVFYPLETYHTNVDLRHTKQVTSVCSERWLEAYTPKQLSETHLAKFDAVAVISVRLLSLLHEHHPLVRLCPDGTEVGIFKRMTMRDGPLKVGWAGNARDPIKQLDILKEVCEGLCELHIADGSLSEFEMTRFYNDIDVIVNCSQSEGGPRTLVEGMSCGNFPVAFPVGIAPEIIEHKQNGLLVEQADAAGLHSALSWCASNLDYVRSCWRLNRELVWSQRSATYAANRMIDLYNDVLNS